MADQHFILTIADDSQDARDLYEGQISCAVCGCTNQERPKPIWVFPGLCNTCAPRVVSVSRPAPRAAHNQTRQASMFDFAGRMPD